MDIRRIRWTAAVAAVLVLAAGGGAQAAPQFTFWAEYALSYTDDTFTTSYDTLLTAPDATAPDDFHEFRLMMSTSGAAAVPDESFAAALVDIDLGLGLTPATLMGGGLWTPDYPSYDPPGASPPVYLFSTSVDGGSDPTDLQRLWILTNRVAAHGLDPGEAGAFLVGSFYLWYDRSLAPELPAGSAVKVSPSVAMDPLAYWSATDFLILSDAAFTQGPSAWVPGIPATVPEPASVVLAGLATIGLLGVARRRR